MTSSWHHRGVISLDSETVWLLRNSSHNTSKIPFWFYWRHFNTMKSNSIKADSGGYVKVSGLTWSLKTFLWVFVFVLNSSENRVCEAARRGRGCRVEERLWWSRACSSVRSCLCVDGRHVAQATVEAAHLEENTLLWAWRELTSCISLQLLGQTESWSWREKNHSYLYKKKQKTFELWFLEGPKTSVPYHQSQRWPLTCESHCADGQSRRESLLGCGRHRPTAPSWKSLRNGSSSQSCRDILGNERGSESGRK